MFIVAWTTGSYIASNDHYVLVDTLDEAHAEARKLATREGVLCWGIAPVLDASEPHWYDTVEWEDVVADATRRSV